MCANERDSMQNPSWAYEYRNLIPRILAEGHDVIALDLIGHGMSDRLLNIDEISVELHAFTVQTLINKVNCADILHIHLSLYGRL